MVTGHWSLVTGHSSLVTRHSSFVIGLLTSADGRLAPHDCRCVATHMPRPQDVVWPSGERLSTTRHPVGCPSAEGSLCATLDLTSAT